MKALIASLAAVAALTLTGCTTTAPAPAVTVTAPAPTETSTPTKTPEVTVGPVERAPLSTAPAQSGRISDSEFVALIREKNPSMAGVPASNILGLAHSVCDAFDQGVSKNQVIQILIDSAGGNRTFEGAMGYIAGAGVANYCPEHQSKFQ